MKIKIVKGNQILGRFDTSKKGEINFHESVRLKNRRPGSTLKVKVSLPGGNGINKDLKTELEKKVINNKEKEQPKKEAQSDTIAMATEPKVEITGDLALKIQEAMTSGEETNEEMTKKILKQYGLEEGNKQEQDDEEDTEVSESKINEY